MICRFGNLAEAIATADVTLNSVNVAKGCSALKLSSLATRPWLPVWYLEMKLQRKRLSDPALSWADRCEGPSMN